MSGVHKYPTISFRVSPRQREEIEAKILASGLSKKDYFIRSCIYNRVCVVGKKEVIYKLVQELETMQTTIKEVAGQLEQGKTDISAEGLEDMKHDFLDMLKAIFLLLTWQSFPFCQQCCKMKDKGCLALSWVALHYGYLSIRDIWIPEPAYLPCFHILHIYQTVVLFSLFFHPYPPLNHFVEFQQSLCYSVIAGYINNRLCLLLCIESRSM